MDTSRRMVIDALEMRSTKGLPALKHWYTTELIDAHKQELDAIKTEYPDDLIFMDWEERDAYFRGGIDEWGCRWAISRDGVAASPTDPLLSDWRSRDTLLAGHFPSLDRERRIKLMSAGKDPASERFMLGRIFRTFAERVQIFRGMENFLIDLYDNEKELNGLLERLFDFVARIIRLFAEAGADAVFLGDDWGTQTGLLVSPYQWRRIFKPWYSKLCRAIHEEGMYVFFHSCGNVREIIGDFIECGVDCLNPLQPNAMDVGRIAAEFGGKISFFGGIDTQITLISSDPDDVMREVLSRAESFSRFNGGYICAPSTSIMPETPISNIESMCKAISRLNAK